VLNISTTLSGMISHARLFVTGQLRNPSQMLAVENHCIRDSRKSWQNNGKKTRQT